MANQSTVNALLAQYPALRQFQDRLLASPDNLVGAEADLLLRSNDENYRKDAGLASDLAGSLSRGETKADAMKRFGITSNTEYNRLLNLGQQQQEFQGLAESQFPQRTLPSQVAGYTAPQNVQTLSGSLNQGSRADIRKLLLASDPSFKKLSIKDQGAAIDSYINSQVNQQPAGTQGQQDQLQFNTGIPEYDQILNEQYLPLLEAEFASDPSALMNDEKYKAAIDKIKGYVEQQYGPVFTKAQEAVNQTYGLQEEGIRAKGSEFAQEESTQLSREEEDKQRNLALNAENYEEAQMRTRESFRQRNLTFSGLRSAQESKLKQQEQQKADEISLNAQRSKEDIGRQLQSEIGATTENVGQFLQPGAQFGGSVGRSLSQSALDKQSELDKIQEQRALAERQRMQEVLSIPTTLSKIS